jgi:hypothetical protein
MERLLACPVCAGRSIKVLASLKDYPFTEKIAPLGIAASQTEFTSDQALLICQVCSHGFLENQYDPKLLYHSDYQTVSAKSEPASAATRRLLSFANSVFPLSEMEMVFDVGANDGTLLHQTEEFGFQGFKVALDPSVSDWQEGIIGHTAFIEDFNFSLLPQVRGARLIIASHVLEHVADPVTVVSRLASEMTKDDLLVLQFPALEPLIMEKRFDQVHHQHFHYFTWTSFNRLIQEAGLEVVNSKVDWIHYGAGNVALKKSEFAKQLAPLSSFPWGDPSLAGFSDIRGEVSLSAYSDYIRFQQVIDSSLAIKPYVALGAGLMSPIVFYYLPQGWKNCEAIFDQDTSKAGLRYANTPRSITLMPDVLSGLNVLVSGSVSRGAGRKLFELAASKDARSINFPVLNA